MSVMPASVMARCGPQLRSPTGGYFVTETKASASAAVLIIGAITPSAPMSSTRLATAKAPTGMRTIGAAPAWRIAAIPVTVPAVSHSPCCWSRVTAGKPSRPSVSATIGYGSGHQPVCTVSPDLSRRARENCAVIEVLPRSKRLFARLDLADRARHQLGHDLADLVVRLRHALGVEILAHLAERIVRLDLGDDHRFRIVGGGVAGQPHLLRGPQAEQAVAPRGRL